MSRDRIDLDDYATCASCILFVYTTFGTGIYLVITIFDSSYLPELTQSMWMSTISIIICTVQFSRILNEK